MEEFSQRDKQNLVTFSKLLNLANTVVMDGEVVRDGLILGYRLPQSNYQRLYIEICRINEVEYDEDNDIPDEFEITVGTILFKIELKTKEK